MPITFLSISQTEATSIIEAVIYKAMNDGGGPVAVAVVDYAGRLIAFAAMDHVMPASIKLAQSKAYSAVVGKRDTIQWAVFKKNIDTVDFDMRNWTDENFTGFTGGITIQYDDQIIGGIGVSGRKGKQGVGDLLMQDNELAEYGRSMLPVQNTGEQTNYKKTNAEN
jgi:glc operon protein GlcG